MENPTKQRLTQFIEKKRISQRQFERLVGVSSGYFTHLRDAPKELVLQRIFNSFPDLSRDWLLTGEGDMLTPSVSVTQGDHSTAIGNGSGNTNNYNSDAVIAILNEQLRVKDRQIEGLIAALQQK